MPWAVSTASMNSPASSPVSAGATESAVLLKFAFRLGRDRSGTGSIAEHQRSHGVELLADLVDASCSTDDALGSTIRVDLNQGSSLSFGIRFLPCSEGALCDVAPDNKREIVGGLENFSEEASAFQATDVSTRSRTGSKPNPPKQLVLGERLNHRRFPRGSMRRCASMARSVAADAP